MLRVAAIHRHFREQGTWVVWHRTCDGLKAGSMDMPVKGIAVGWQSSQAALEQAHALGCNLFITHEPTFYSHMDDRQDWLDTPAAQRKRAFLAETGMSVYRCHDVWDVYPALGVVDAWGAFLDLGAPIAQEGYYRLYQVPPTTAYEMAHQIAYRVKELGEQSVDLVGAKWQMISRLAVGTGAITSVRQMVDLGADIVVTSNDGITYWRDAAWAADSALPMIVVDHQTSEMPGMRNLRDYLAERFDVPCHLVGTTCTHEIFATQKACEIAVRMRRDSLDDLAPVVLDEAYNLRPMAADEVWAYLQVMNRSIFQGEADAKWFENGFAKDPQYDPSFVQIIWRGEQPVAAATAWHQTENGEPWGVVHWVGVDAQERGHGLGKAVVTATLHRLKERGFTQALLGTQSWRLPAIAAYARLGFYPWPDKTGTQQVWDQIMADTQAWRAQGRPSLWGESLNG